MREETSLQKMFMEETKKSHVDISPQEMKLQYTHSFM